MSPRLLTTLIVAAVLLVTSAAQLPAQPDGPMDDQTPRKVALLVGVNRYLKPGFSDLDFAEADVTAVAAELRKLGFEVITLLGSGQGDQQATKVNIEAAARTMVVPLGKHDVALVMLSGHGQQLQPDPQADPNQINFDKTQSFYCPVDARVNDPASQVSLSFLLDDILARDVGRKLLVVDACRDVPIDRHKGARNARGIEGRVVALPEGMGVFFSCSAGQTSFERAELGHGLFTYCLLEGLRGGAIQDGEIAWSDLFGFVNRRMSKPDIAKFMPSAMRQVPIQAGALPHTVLGKLDVRPEMTIPMPRPTVPPSPPGRGDGGEGLEGQRAGEVRSFTDLGVKFCWCPPGNFVMGSPASEASREADEDQINVILSHGFWLGQTEVTQGLWQNVMGTTPWKGERQVKEGWNYPATCVSWDDASEFCRKLTQRERAAGRLPNRWSYQLPTEAQREYACRAGTTGPYNWHGSGVLSDYAWYGVNAWVIGEEYAHAVGQKKPNSWGLLDMHGNVWEWCQDSYREKAPGGRDPLVSSEGSSRVYRGGVWFYAAEWRCRSADRDGFSPSSHGNGLGFRCSLSPSGE